MIHEVAGRRVVARAASPPSLDLDLCPLLSILPVFLGPVPGLVLLGQAVVEELDLVPHVLVHHALSLLILSQGEPFAIVFYLL